MARSRARTTLAAGLAAAALALAGCGVTTSDDAGGVVTVEGPGVPESFGGESGAARLRESATATSEVTTAQMSMTMSMAGMPMLGDVEITAEGQMDNAARRSRVVMDMGDMLSMLGESSGTMEMILDGDDAYVRSDLYNDLMGSDAEWFRASAGDLTGGSVMSSPQGGDPTQFLAFLEQAGGEIEELGTEEVRGVPTRPLRTEIDLATLAGQMGEGQAEELQESLDGLGVPEGAALTLPTEVWLDDDGFVRRFRMVFDFGAFAAGTEEDVAADLSGVTMTVEYEMWGFGEPVDITIPSPDQVEELDPSMLGGG